MCLQCKCSHVPDHGACDEFEAGANGRCVYCDHAEGCHPGTGKFFNLPLQVGERPTAIGGNVLTAPVPQIMGLAEDIPQDILALAAAAHAIGFNSFWYSAGVGLFAHPADANMEDDRLLITPKLIEYYKSKGSQPNPEPAGHKLLRGEITIETIIEWLYSKERCDSSELMEAVVQWLAKKHLDMIGEMMVKSQLLMAEQHTLRRYRELYGPLPVDGGDQDRNILRRSG